MKWYIVKHEWFAAEYVEFTVASQLRSWLWRYGCKARPRDPHS